jgi:Ca-activated chloride channel homolog
MNLSAIEFAQAVWFWLTPVPLLWAWRTLKSAARDGDIGLTVRHPGLSEAVLYTPTPGPIRPTLLYALGLLCLIIALAQPRTQGAWITPPAQGRDLALVIDTSLTMSIDDFTLEGKKVTRLAMLKAVLTPFVNARTADRIGLFVFGSEAAALTPPTRDHAHLNAQIARLQVGMAGDDTALGDALGLALKQVRYGPLRPVIILVSDGEPGNSGDLTVAEAVAIARDQGTAIHTLRIGGDLFAAGRVTPPTAHPQPDRAEIARLTGGQHWVITTTADAQTVIAAIDRLERPRTPPPRQRVSQEGYLIPLWIGVLFLLLARLTGPRRTT